MLAHLQLHCRCIPVQDSLHTPYSRVLRRSRRRKVLEDFRHIVRAAADKKGDGKEPKQSVRTTKMMERFVETLFWSPGVLGTSSILVGRLLNVDPFGHLHWNSHDVLLGVIWALPIIALDAVDVVAESAPGYIEKSIKADLAMMHDLKERSVEYGPVPSDCASRPPPVSHPQSVQIWTPDEVLGQIRARQNAKDMLRPRTPRGPTALGQFGPAFPRKGLPLPLALVQTMLYCLGVEMFQRGICVGGLGHWVTDRLGELGVDELAFEMYLGALPAHGATPLEQTGQLGALLLIIAFTLGTSVVVSKQEWLKLERSQRAAAKRMDQTLRKLKLQGGKGADLMRILSPPNHAAALQAMRDDFDARTQAEAFASLLVRVCASAPFILTGNLAASYTTQLTWAAVSTALSYAQELQRQRKMAILRTKLRALNDRLADFQVISDQYLKRKAEMDAQKQARKQD